MWQSSRVHGLSLWPRESSSCFTTTSSLMIALSSSRIPKLSTIRLMLNEIGMLLLPNSFGTPVLHFHPHNSDPLIPTGNRDCSSSSRNCRAKAQFSRDNGRRWTFVESYVCPKFALSQKIINAKLSAKATMISRVQTRRSLLAVIFSQNKKKLFPAVVGIAECLVLAEVIVV